jgi:hypothetical protein
MKDTQTKMDHFQILRKKNFNTLYDHQSKFLQLFGHKGLLKYHDHFENSNIIFILFLDHTVVKLSSVFTQTLQNFTNDHFAVGNVKIMWAVAV